MGEERKKRGRPMHLPPESRTEAIRLYCEGRTARWIAEHLGMPYSPTQRFLLAAMREHRIKHEADRDAELARHTALLNRVAVDLVSEWERSKRDAESIKITDPMEVVVKGKVVRVAGKTERTIKGRHGDAALIRELRGVLADIRSMQGLDAPKRVDVTSDGKAIGAPIEYVEVVPPDAIEGPTEDTQDAPPD